MLDRRTTETRAYIQYVVLYKVNEPDTTYYSDLKIYQTLGYRNLRAEGWRNAKLGDKAACKQFLKFVKHREGVTFVSDRKRSIPVLLQNSFEAA